MSADVTVTVAPVYGRVMPLQPRHYVSTLTPEAAAEIPPVVAAEREAYAAWQEALDVRDDVMRRHHAAGVDVRDLVPLTAYRDRDPLHRTQVHRIVSGARSEE